MFFCVIFFSGDYGGHVYISTPCLTLIQYSQSSPSYISKGWGKSKKTKNKWKKKKAHCLAQLHITFTGRSCRCNLLECVFMNMLGPSFCIRLYWDEWGHVRYFMCSDSIHNVYCGGLFERHYVDAWYSDTHTYTLWYGYIYTFCCFRVWICYNQSYRFLSSFRYCWVFVVSAALRGTWVTGVPTPPSPKSRQQKVFLVAEFCTAGQSEGGRERGWLATSWLCTFLLSVTDFWTPANVNQIPNPPHSPPPPPPPMQVLQWLQPPSLFFNYYYF